MSRDLKWIDSHGHLTDPRLDSCREQWVQEALDLGIGFFMQGGIGPEEWSRQKQLAQQFPQHIGLCFGLHPYFMIQNSFESCEAALDQLCLEAPKTLGLGEMGLDARGVLFGQNIENTWERQIHFFEAQLEIARVSNRPVVLHIVQAHDKALEILDWNGIPPRQGIVHSFSGNWDLAKKYIDLGLSISVGGPITRSNRTSLREAIRRLPEEFLLLETDSPDQPAEKYKGQLNPLAALKEVAMTVAEIRGRTPEEILDLSAQNFRKLFGVA